ncbi:MAG TPA: histidinol-phosphate transaminase [Actinomycetota bacterium]|nr:histidinol-phosphate transaminase [Actinomycetota bacterium]
MTQAPPLKVRDDLEGVAPYVSPQQPARYRLNTNEAPYPPPIELVQEVARGTEAVALNRYPDRDAVKLVDAISDHVSWPVDGLWVANGSNEVFLHLFLAFGGPGRASVTFEPTYTLHTLIPRIAGTRTLQLQRDEDFRIDLDAGLAAIRAERPEIVIVCSPNNPTGGCEGLATIEALLDAAPGLVVVDEAYGEFDAHEHSARDLLDSHPNLAITKTFSKAWRLAGVRIGYMLAAPGLIAELARVRLPYHLSAITQLVGVSALKHSDRTLDMVRSIVRERDRLGTELTALGIRVFPSSANFVLFEVDDPNEVWSALLERGVLIRNYAGVAGLERCLRVTAGLPEETDAFIAGMREVVDG